LGEFHHRKPPDDAALLDGHTPPDDLGFRSGRLQIWYNNSAEPWRDPDLHWHVVEVPPPVETFMIRAPSVADKRYAADEG